MIFLVYNPLCAYHPYVSCFKTISYGCCFSTSATIAEKFSLHNQWTLPNQQLLVGLDFRACYSVSAKRPSNPVLNTYMLGELNSNVFSLRWQVKHFALIFPNYANYTNQQTSLLMFIPYTLHRKLALTIFCLIFILDLTHPYQSSSGWFSFIIEISLKFDLPPRTICRLLDVTFRMWPSSKLKMQIWRWRNICLIYVETRHNEAEHQVTDFLLSPQ